MVVANSKPGKVTIRQELCIVIRDMGRSYSSTTA